MRVLASVVGTRGDVQPVVALAMELRRRGHDVVLAAPLDLADWIRVQEIDYRPIPVNVAAETLKAGNSPSKVIAMIRKALETERDTLAAIEGGVDLYLGSGMASLGASMAERDGVPHRMAIHCPEILPSDHHGSPIVPWTGMPRWVNRLSWSINERIWNTTCRALINTERKRWGLPEVRSPWQLMIRNPLITADPWLGPAAPDAPANAVVTGPWLVPEREPLPAEVEAFLDGGPPPVYFGFGSMADPKPQRTAAAMIGAAKRLGVRALISAGWAGLRAEDLPETVRIIGPASHARLFPRCSVIVHHGGAGTTTAAAIAGTPQVIVPHLGDQYWWSHRIHALGLGPPALRRRGLSEDSLSQAVAFARQPAVVAAAKAGAPRIIRDGVSRAADAIEKLGTGCDFSRTGRSVQAHSNER